MRSQRGKGPCIQIGAAGLDEMVMASVLHHPVPPLEAKHTTPPEAWLRCMDAMAAIESMMPQTHACDGDTKGNLLFSDYNIDQVSGSSHKQRVDALLAMHAKRVFPSLPATLAADPSLVFLLLDAPNILTTMALADAFPELRTSALATRICIPQADPAHYALMLAECRMLLNVRFQRLDTWLAANANIGLRVPICFLDYETSVYGRSKVQLSPLRDIQRFFRYGYASTTCLLGLTLSYRSLHKDHYPADAPVLTEDDVAAFVKYEAACVGIKGELLECLRYGMVFQLFLLKKNTTADTTMSIATASTSTEAKSDLRTSVLNLAAQSASSSVPVVKPSCHIDRPRQARLIHGYEHVTNRWRELGFVAAGRGIFLALKIARDILDDPGDSTRLYVLSVNHSEGDMPCYQELLDLQGHHPSRLRLAFSLTSASEGWTGFVGRGDVEMAQLALPAPSCSDASTGSADAKEKSKGVMVIVCGRVQDDMRKKTSDFRPGDGEDFVELWGGPMGQKVSTRGKSKMQRVQGSLGGILKEAGFTSDQVFQI